METVRVAVIGHGRSGRDIHAKYLTADPRYKITAVIDALPYRREMAASMCGCETFADYTDILGRNDIDLVVNASFSKDHVKITRDLMLHGFNVLCDKPFASRAADADMLIETAESTGCGLYIFQQSRYAPYYKAVRDVVQSGVLGRLVQVSISFSDYTRRWDWQTSKKYLGGSLLNTGPHPLDQALTFLPENIMPQVFCKMDSVNVAGDAEDYVRLIMTAPDLPLIDVEVSCCSAYPKFTYVIQGSRGGLSGTMSHIDWKYFIPEENAPLALDLEPLRDADGNPLYCREKLLWHEDSWDMPETGLFDSMSAAYYDKLYRCLTTGEKHDVTHAQVRRQIAVIEQCHMQNGGAR